MAKTSVIVQYPKSGQLKKTHNQKILTNMADLVSNLTGQPTDLYPFMTDNNPVKWGAMTLSIIFTVLGPIGLYSAIWLEQYGNDQKRTLLNMLFSRVCWTGIVSCVSVQMIEMMRHVVGPLSSTVCFLNLLARYILAQVCLNFLNGMIITR